VIYFSTNFYKECWCFVNLKTFLIHLWLSWKKNSTSSDIGITDMAIQTEETTPVKDDIHIYKENPPKNMSLTRGLNR
jgi:hypothetical protein